MASGAECVPKEGAAGPVWTLCPGEYAVEKLHCSGLYMNCLTLSCP